MTPSPAAQLNGFLAKYTPDVAKTAKAALVRMRRRLPGAIELVYDNTYALAIGFASTERTSSAVFSIAVFPRWVSLFFLQTGAHLSDPHGRLRGSGNQVRTSGWRPRRTSTRPPSRRYNLDSIRRSGTSQISATER